MAILILFVVLGFEIGFAIYCMVTKQKHKKIKNWIRIAIFIAFVILTLSSVIVWSFRWVMLAILLFIFCKGNSFSYP